MHIDGYYGYVQMFTDASKSSDGKIGVFYIVPEFGVKVGKRVNENLSVYTGEMLAILLALQWVEEVRPLRSVICSDSGSIASLQYSHSDSREDILMEIRQVLYRIQMMGLIVVFLWIPAHIGVKRNEEADRAAKAAISRAVIDMSKLD